MTSKGDTKDILDGLRWHVSSDQCVVVSSLGVNEVQHVTTYGGSWGAEWIFPWLNLQILSEVNYFRGKLALGFY